MAAKDKVQCPIRLHKSQYAKIRKLCGQDGITFQKLVEVLLLGYMKNNREIKRLIKVYADGKYARKKDKVITDTESDELLSIIEEEHTPLRELEKIISEELENEQSNSYPSGFEL